MSDEHPEYSVSMFMTKDEPTRLAAIQRLGTSNVPLGEAVPFLVAALNDSNFEVSTAAAVVLKNMGKSSILHLVHFIESDHEDEEMRYYAADALGDLGLMGLPFLVKLAEGPDTTIRMMAIEAIPRAGTAGETAIPMLAKALHDPEVMDSSAIALAQLAKFRLLGGKEKGEALNILVASCKNDNATVRRSAISALRFLGDKISCVVPTLTDAANDSDEEVRDTATEVLENIRTN